MKLKQILQESYQIYHDRYYEAVKEFLNQIKKAGYSYDDEEVAQIIGINSKRPGPGKYVKFSLPLYKNGKLNKKYAHASIYGMEGRNEKYELTMYIN